MDDRFDISILDSGDPARVIAVARCGYDIAIEPLPCDTLQKLFDFNSNLLNATSGKGKRPLVQELGDYGQNLFNFILQKDVYRIYARLPNSHIRLQIYSNRPDLQAVPWEFLHDPGTVPGPNSFRTVIRIVPTIGVHPPEPRSFGKKVRMLFVQAEPVGEDSVSWLDIKESIEREFSAELPNEFEIEPIEGTSRQAFMNAFTVKNYDILHFSGHGEISKDGVGSLLFENRKTKKKDPISAVQLGNFLKNKNLRLVVLSACNTSAGNFSKEFAVVAKTLVECGIPAVVANQFPITNSIATAFAGGFYSELVKSGDVDRATAEGRIRLNFGPPLADGAARIEWGIPTLYRHLGAAKVFAP